MSGKDALISVAASLEAAISLLERVPQAKKAVASDRMFDQMIKDYKASLEKARKELRDSLMEPSPMSPKEELDFLRTSNRLLREEVVRLRKMREDSENGRKIGRLKYIGELPNGCGLWVAPNEAGGRTYWSNECGIETFIWDTALVCRSSVLAALVAEEKIEYAEAIRKHYEAKGDPTEPVSGKGKMSAPDPSIL
jgi:hypothetical protein